MREEPKFQQNLKGGASKKGANQVSLNVEKIAARCGDPKLLAEEISAI